MQASAYTTGLMIARCTDGQCSFVMQSSNCKGKTEWQYSFEGECTHVIKAATQNQDYVNCQGIIHDQLQPLVTAQPHILSPASMVSMLDGMGQAIQTRPIFAKLYHASSDKHEFVKAVAPFVYQGSGLGVRSAFCPLTAESNAKLCAACDKLYYFDALWERGINKGEQLLDLAQQLQTPQPVALKPVRHEYLVTPELRHLAAQNSKARHNLAVIASRSKSAREECREQLRVLEAKMKAGSDDVPEFCKLFSIAAKKGDCANMPAVIACSAITRSCMSHLHMYCTLFAVVFVAAWHCICLVRGVLQAS